MPQTRKHRRVRRGGAATKSQKMLKLRTAYDNAVENYHAEVQQQRKKFEVAHDLEFEYKTNKQFLGKLERELKAAKKEWYTQVKATEKAQKKMHAAETKLEQTQD